MDALPRNVIAHVGSFLDARSRNACFFASACLNNVHETVLAHTLHFSGTADAKFAAAARIVRHVLALMPRLTSLTVAFSSFFDGREYPDSCARFRECMRGLPARVAVRMEFTRCAPAFVRGTVWDRACTVSLLLMPYDISKVKEVADCVDAIEHLECGPNAFSDLPSATMARVRNVAVTMLHNGTALDLREVNPQKTRVLLRGCVMGFDSRTSLVDMCLHFFDTEVFFISG